MEEYKRLSRCGVDNCKQTLFYLENGQWFCKNGHLREGELETAADDEGFGTQGSRAARATEQTKRVEKVLRGRKGFELYIQCYQIILQKQVWWLVHKKGFPEELEVIVHDLWALRLQILSSTIPSAQVAQSQASSIIGSQGTEVATDAGSENEEEEVDQESDKGHSSYLYTSDSDIASTTRSIKKRRQRLVPKASDRPKLVESLCLCYLGLVLLRSAVLLGDFHRWVDSQHLPYIRAIRCVPEAMKDKLSAEYWSALDPKSRLRRGRLYTTVHAMVVVLHEKFGVTFPPVNRELLLVRYVNELGLPLEIYTAVKRLAEKLFVTFEWPAMPRTKRTAYWPEARLMAIVVVATKLSYGLDGIKRVPKTSGEPAATGVKWEAWERFLRAGNEEKGGVLVAEEPRKKGGLEVDVEEADIFAMENEELDWYMDWYEKTWCSGDEEGMTKLSEGILNLFPTSRRPEDDNPAPRPPRKGGTETLLSRLATLNAETNNVAPDPTENESTQRPGEQYLWYSYDEELPHQLKTLIQAAADLLAIERGDLLKVLRSVETTLKEQVKETRRNDRRRAKMEEVIARRNGTQIGE